MNILAQAPFLKFFDSAGKALNAGKLYTYESGTNTPLATYTTKAGTAHQNPITLSTTGTAVVWLQKGKAYRFVTKTAAGVTVDTWDNISANSTEDIVVTDFGADPSGVADSKDAFEDAATEADGGDVYVPKGDYLLSADVTGNWVISDGCTFTTGRPKQAERGPWEDQVAGANIKRFRDRVLIGDACDYDGQKVGSAGDRSWVGLSAGGDLTYFDTRSTAAVYSSFGGVSLASATRTSDNDRTGEVAGIGVASYAKNDNTNAADKKSAWAFYGHAVQHEANRFTVGAEIDVCSLQTVVDCNPFSTGVEGTTAGLWLAVGGETARDIVANGDPTTLKNVSCALAIVQNGEADRSTATENSFAKGIVFGVNALEGSDDTGGRACALQLGIGHEIRWAYSSGVNATCGAIRGDGNSAANQIRLIFTSTGLEFRGVNADLTTENVSMRVAPLASAANYPALYPGLASGPVKIKSEGSDTNIDLQLEPKGSGVLRFGVWASSGDVAVNGYITIKDDAGTTRKLATVA